jgi:predicted nucleotidyltransferase
MKILVKSNRDPLNGLSRSEVLTLLTDSLRSRCTAAYVFGSIARDDMHSESDIDCIIVCETKRSFPERSSLFDDLRDRLPALEILVYTPEEFSRLTNEPSSGFWTPVTRDIVRIV